MITIIKEKIKLLTEKFSEAWLACALTMVKGNLAVLSIGHAIVASETGIIAGLAVVTSSFLPIRKSKIVNTWFVGFFTACADLIIHPTHFGPSWAEAVVTGIGAAILSYVVETHLENKKLAKTAVDNTTKQ